MAGEDDNETQPACRACRRIERTQRQPQREIDEPVQRTEAGAGDAASRGITGGSQRTVKEHAGQRKRYRDDAEHRHRKEINRGCDQ